MMELEARAAEQIREMIVRRAAELSRQIARGVEEAGRDAAQARRDEEAQPELPLSMPA